MIQLSTLNYVRHRGSLLINCFFFYLHFAATQPTLCNCIEDSLTKSMLNTAFFFSFLLLFHSYFNPVACRSLEASLASLRLFKHKGFFKCATSNVTCQTNEPLFHSYRYVDIKTYFKSSLSSDLLLMVLVFTLKYLLHILFVVYLYFPMCLNSFS